jgi:hypothetical protein
MKVPDALNIHTSLVQTRAPCLHPIHLHVAMHLLTPDDGLFSVAQLLITPSTPRMLILCFITTLAWHTHPSTVSEPISNCPFGLSTATLSC